MRRVFNKLALLPAGLLAGCMNLAPNYQPPAAPVPAAWTSLPATSESSTASALDTGWRDFFTDERLRNVVALALANNRDLKVAALNIERARAQYNISRADLYPTLNAGADGSRTRTPASTASSGKSSVSNRFSADLSFTSYEIDFFGRVKNLNEAALQDFFQTEENRRSTQISLVASVANAWLTLAADLQRLQLARNTLDSQRRSYSLVERAHALGAQSGLALAQSQSTVDAARADVAEFDGQVERDRNALALLVGATPPAEWLPLENTLLPEQSAARLMAPPAGLPSSVLQQRPDVLAAEHALRASNADIGAARAAFYPRIALTGSAGTASPTLSGLFQGANRAWSFGPSISIPIFDGGANRAGLKAAEVQRDIQIATYEKTLQTAFREVADALAARRTLAERLAAQQSLVAATSRSFELSQALFKSGSGSYLDVLDAQRSLYAVQQSLIGLLLTEQANRLSLYKVLGGSWSEATTTATTANAGSSQ